MSAADFPLIPIAGDAGSDALVEKPAEQYALVSGDLDHPDMDQLSSRSMASFGYISATALSAWNQGFGSQPDATRGIDQFIGEPDLIGRGMGRISFGNLSTLAAIGYTAGGDRSRSGPTPARACL